MYEGVGSWETKRVLAQAQFCAPREVLRRCLSLRLFEAICEIAWSYTFTRATGVTRLSPVIINGFADTIQPQVLVTMFGRSSGKHGERLGCGKFGLR
jgi:hypothetical protein